LVALAGCEKQQPAPVMAPSQPQLPAGHPPMTAANPAINYGNLQGGIVKEIKNGGGYTYALVERDGRKIWAAGPQSAIKVGDPVAWADGSLMRNFKSSTLDTTFEEIFFISAFIDPTRMPAASAPSTAQQGPQGKVMEVLNGGGYTYAKVNQGDKTIWVAGPMAAVEVGQQISWQQGSLMTNFKSSSLNRTFDEIYFSAGFTSANPQESATQQAFNHGIVEEVIKAAGYDYIQVKVDNQLLWLAAPESNVVQKNAIRWRNGAVMKNFKSSSLNREFAEIIFVDAVEVSG
jgi:hypothetical protein